MMRKAIVVVPRTGAGTNADPYRNALTVDWSDATGQPIEDIITGKLAYTVEVTCTDAQLAAIRTNAAYAVLYDWDADADAGTPPASLDAAGMTALKAKLAALYAGDVVDYVTLAKSDPAQIAAALVECQKRPPWKAGIDVKPGDVYAYDKNLYQAIQPHRTQADWTPPVTPALWNRFHSAGAGPQPWVQPQGAHDAYPLGAKVTYAGKTWESTVAANVWRPGVYGWVVV